MAGGEARARGRRSGRGTTELLGQHRGWRKRATGTMADQERRARSEGRFVGRGLPLGSGRHELRPSRGGRRAKLGVVTGASALSPDDPVVGTTRFALQYRKSFQKAAKTWPILNYNSQKPHVALTLKLLGYTLALEHKYKWDGLMRRSIYVSLGLTF